MPAWIAKIRKEKAFVDGRGIGGQPDNIKP
jgi:hypothetical protein